MKNVFLIAGVFLALTLSGCSTSSDIKHERMEVNDALIDAHKNNVKWLRAIVAAQQMDLLCQARCGFYLTLDEIRARKTISEFSCDASVVYWLDPRICGVSRMNPGIGGHAPPITGPWVGSIGFKMRSIGFEVPDEREYAVWIGLSEDLTSEDVYFALSHPASALAKRVYFTGAYCRDDFGYPLLQSDP